MTSFLLTSARAGVSLLPLHEGWTFFHPATNRDYKAQVPGCIHQDLQNHNLIPDPFYGTEELNLQWIEEADWEYRCEFHLEAGWDTPQNLDLVFEGLDTVACVFLNDALILESENMFHAHRVPVKDTLQTGVNTLRIRFGSAMEYIRTHRMDFHSPKEFNDPVGDSCRIRKQQCQFGWDWGPRFVTCGIWKPVRLEAWQSNRLESVHIRQIHTPELVELHLTPELARENQGELRGEVRFQGAVVATIESGIARIKNPQLWWPAGQGEQPLYEVEAHWLEDGRVVDEWQRQIGLRTVELDTAPDEFEVESRGNAMTRFGFRVNGRLIFAKGANWIPAHAFVAGLGRADYESQLRDAVAANMNMLRVWGGGIYEDDAFYELCDELGLMVWQDFMFACAMYPADDAFVESVRVEAAQNVQRLRHHASLALWCGDNEIVLLLGQFFDDPSLLQGYKRVFLDLLPQVLQATDGATPYIYSSPCYPIPQLELRPASFDEHDWKVWHARFPVAHYETTNHRFVSEFGMQSYPSPEIARTFCPEDQLNVFSPVFENHQKNSGGNQIIFDYVSRLYRFPKDYRSVAYLSQLNQAYCMKAAVEHFRRQSPQCLGALYWQLNDVWPVASWSGLEFGGKWKALHHYARRFFAPFLISARHVGSETRGIGNYSQNTRGEVELFAVSDAPHAADVTLRWRLCRLDGSVLKEDSTSVRLEPAIGQKVQTLDLTAEVEQAGRASVYLRLELLDSQGATVSEDTVFFVAPRAIELQQAPIETHWQMEAPNLWRLSATSGVFQHRVCLELEGFNARWSDNFFDLHPDEERAIEVRFGAPMSREDCARLLAYSLVDSYR